MSRKAGGKRRQATEENKKLPLDRWDRVGNHLSDRRARFVAERLQKLVELRTRLCILEDERRREKHWRRRSSQSPNHATQERDVEARLAQQRFQNALAYEEIPNWSTRVGAGCLFHQIEQHVDPSRLEEIDHRGADLRPHGADLDGDLDHSLRLAFCGNARARDGFRYASGAGHAFERLAVLLRERIVETPVVDEATHHISHVGIGLGAWTTRRRRMVRELGEHAQHRV